MNSFCTYTAHNILLQKNEESNEIQRSQNNYFLFNTTENIYTFMYFGASKIVSEFFKKMKFLP